MAISLHSHQQCIRVPVTPLFWPAFGVISVLNFGHSYRFVVYLLVLICVSLMTWYRVSFHMLICNPHIHSWFSVSLILHLCVQTCYFMHCHCLNSNHHILPTRPTSLITLYYSSASLSPVTLVFFLYSYSTHSYLDQYSHYLAFILSVPQAFVYCPLR